LNSFSLYARHRMRRGSSELNSLCKNAAQLPKSDQCEVASKEKQRAPQDLRRPTFPQLACRKEERDIASSYRNVHDRTRRSSLWEFHRGRCDENRPEARKGTSRTPGLSFRRDLKCKSQLERSEMQITTFMIPVVHTNDTLS